ncbi:MFS transporter [Leucobacter sp. OLJS4]|uniref:MFS transporter n=1 Tax=unclassified Leucobacter TaxID=2621730 RepID=UPI000C19B840|nr:MULTISPECIES: MFS transporter [unclassified Leucobacter]PIJ19627.1 MFS transporter [Leucobacter sp. OLES1]PII86636.1 MFS transporter [Leucobacter sp. OLCALW19]PII88998.1 MFS transporter [Leucobacter sp. OLAS13]PII96087.1 MFS transporter [Leucobacter sp. OLTLW20]PII99361.1 MFS transporter [Leucobacter sp. OLDS2]
MSETTKTSAIEYQATQELTVAEANRVALGALIGTALEWYDFFLFSAAAALVFNVQYFTSENATAAALASFATFGVGLAARPIGGMIFGRMGDRIGRRVVLMITIVGIGLVTGLIGLLPTYAAIGIAAPILLVLLRVLQGLFVGGEWSGAMTLVVENAPLHLRARYAAIPQIGSPIGTILSSGGFFVATLVFSQQNFDAWGWRIPFLIALPLLLIAVFIRSRLEESPVFRQLEESGEVVKSPVLTTFRDSWKQIIVGMAAALLGVGGFYLVTAFCVWYGVNVLHYDSSLMLLGSMVAAAFEILALLWGGHLGTKYGASRVILWGGVASAVVAVPAFLLLASGNPVLVVIAMTLAVCTLSLPYAASGTVLTGLFPAKTRYTGVGLAQNVAGMLSGFIPLLATGFVASAANHWWPAAAMLVFLSLFTAVAGVIAPRLSVRLPGFKH